VHRVPWAEFWISAGQRIRQFAIARRGVVPLACNERSIFSRSNRGQNFSEVAALAWGAAKAHTPSMTLKNAALLALIGTLLVTVLLTWDLLQNILNVGRGLIPAVVLFSSFLEAFGAFSVAVFFFVFHRAQS
jgi:hypothetical protein